MLTIYSKEIKRNMISYIRPSIYWNWSPCYFIISTEPCTHILIHIRRHKIPSWETPVLGALCCAASEHAQGWTYKWCNDSFGSHICPWNFSHLETAHLIACSSSILTAQNELGNPIWVIKSELRVQTAQLGNAEVIILYNSCWLGNFLFSFALGLL